MDIPASSMPLSSPPVKWIHLGSSLLFLLRSPRLLGWSLLLVLFTFGLTWGGYLLAVGFIDSRAAGFFDHIPAATGIWDTLRHYGWLILKWAFFVTSRIAAFYLAFLVAYTLSSPGYAFLSISTEKKQAGEAYEEDALTVRGVLVDIWEGLKIGLFGLVVTALALMANFVPLVGQAAVVVLYTFYSALMFVDYPSSRRRWSLGRKISWLSRHRGRAFRLGILPAVVSLIPVVNIFLMAFLFPLFTVHATLNFVAMAAAEKEGEAEKVGSQIRPARP